MQVLYAQLHIKYVCNKFMDSTALFAFANKAAIWLHSQLELTDDHGIKYTLLINYSVRAINEEYGIKEKAQQ